MATTGSATLDFGAFPGGSDASVAVTGQSGISSGSFVEAWLYPTATADHTADEHMIETIKIVAGNISAGVGFTIYGVNTSQLNEPLTSVPNATTIIQTAATTVGLKTCQPGIVDGGGKGTRIYGTWTVKWVWV